MEKKSRLEIYLEHATEGGFGMQCLWRDLPCVCGLDKPCGNLAAERGEPVDVVAALSSARAEVERLSRVEAAAKAWEEWPVSLDSDIPPDVVAMKIRQGILPNGKPVKP